MNWKLFFGLVTGITAYTLILLGFNTVKAEMPYPSAVYFASDMTRIPCTFAEAPGFACVVGVSFPHPDPRKQITAAK